MPTILSAMRAVLLLLGVLLFIVVVSNEASAQCGDPDHQGKTFWNVHNVLVHIQLPGGPPDNYNWPHSVGGSGFLEIVSPVIEKHLKPCIVSKDGTVSYVPRGYDERMGDPNTLTVLIWSDFEGYSYYAARERQDDPAFVVIHVGFYRLLDPEAQFLDWRFIRSSKITLNDPATSVTDQIHDFLDKALKPRKYKPHPEDFISNSNR